MKKSELKQNLPFLPWAVVAECEVKNNGKSEKFKRIIALFDCPILAEEYIKKCLPEENKSKFSIERIEG